MVGQCSLQRNFALLADLVIVFFCMFLLLCQREGDVEDILTLAIR